MSSAQPLPEVEVAGSRSVCANCRLRANCLPAGLNARDLARLVSLITPRHGIRRGSYLFRPGTELRSLFAIRSGSLKSSVVGDDGREQIMGFYLPGELLGMDAIGSGRHICDVIALEDSEVCKIPYAALEQLARDAPALGRNLKRVMGREIERGYCVMLLLGGMNAGERLATFLLSLSHRLDARGYSPRHFAMRMTRADIGSYLGLKLETVSRTLSRFQREGMLEVQGKEIRLIDPGKLKAIMQGTHPQLDALAAHADSPVMMNGFAATTPPGLLQPRSAGVRSGV